MPVSGLWLTPVQPNSDVVVLPRMIAPSPSQPRHDGRVLGRPVAGEDMAAHLRRHILGDGEILDRHRNAVQPAEPLVLHQCRFGSPRRVHRRIGGEMGERVDARVQRLDPLRAVRVISSTGESFF